MSKSMVGLDEALQLMTVGQRMRVWIPPQLGQAGTNTWVLDIELLGIIRSGRPHSVPPEWVSPGKDE